MRKLFRETLEKGFETGIQFAIARIVEDMENYPRKNKDSAVVYHRLFWLLHTKGEQSKEVGKEERDLMKSLRDVGLSTDQLSMVFRRSKSTIFANLSKRDEAEEDGN